MHEVARLDRELLDAAERIAAAQNVAVLTGAGISKESGIPTFRDAQTGLWANYNPEDLATESGFRADPEMVWGWYDFRRNKVWDTQPNAGHAALAELQQWLAEKRAVFTLITQNIDNLHQRAGSTDVLELHGNIFRYKCLDHHHPAMPENWIEKPSGPPGCPECGGYVRPDVVWFGEMLPESILERSFAAAEACEVMLVVGTSGVVHPAASIPVAAKRAGAFVVEVNPEPSALTESVVDLFLQGPSGIILPELLNALNHRQD